MARFTQLDTRSKQIDILLTFSMVGVPACLSILVNIPNFKCYGPSGVFSLVLSNSSNLVTQEPEPETKSIVVVSP